MNNISNKEFLDKESILKIGKVFSVQGRKVQVIVDSNRNLSVLFFKGEIIRNIAVNSYVKITKGTFKIIGRIEGERIEQIPTTEHSSCLNQKATFVRFLDISLLGYLNFNSYFILGIQELPLVDNECYILDQDELQSIYTPKGSTELLSIGKSPLDGQIVNIDIDRLFASHIGIFGNTGSGKSYTLTKLYHELFQKYKNIPSFPKTSQFVFIDFNGEYIDGNAIINSQYKKTYNLTTNCKNNLDRYPISSETINDIDILSLLFQAKSQTQVPFLKRAINTDYYNNHVFKNNTEIQNHISFLIKRYFHIEKKKIELLNLLEILRTFQNTQNKEWEKVYKCFSSSLSEPLSAQELETYKGYSQQSAMIEKRTEEKTQIFLNCINNYIQGFNFGTSQLKLLELKIILKYYDEILSDFSEEKHIGPLIKRVQTIIPDLDSMFEIKNDIETFPFFLRIISLKNINIKLRKFVPLLIAKELYKQAKQGKIKFLNLIIDEAHNILSEESDRETEYWKDYRLETFEEIIKEGRKFGVFLTIASQRPADISPTILSQLHNYFLHRLVNDKDIYAVQKAISYLDKVSFEYLPIMPIGTTIFSGTAANLPVIIAVEKIPEEFKPNNETLSLTKLWNPENEKNHS